MSGSRTPNFRYIYSNGFRMQFGDNEVMLVFGIKEDPTAKDDNILEETAVVMTLVTAKILATALTRTIERFEANNFVIPLDPAKAQNIEKALDEAMVPPRPSPTA